MRSAFLEPRLEVLLLIELISYVRRETYDSSMFFDFLKNAAAGISKTETYCLAGTWETLVTARMDDNRIILNYAFRSGDKVEQKFSEAIDYYRYLYESDQSNLKLTQPERFLKFKINAIRIFGEPALKGERLYDT